MWVGTNPTKVFCNHKQKIIQHHRNIHTNFYSGVCTSYKQIDRTNISQKKCRFHCRKKNLKKEKKHRSREITKSHFYWHIFFVTNISLVSIYNFRGLILVHKVFVISNVFVFIKRKKYCSSTIDDCIISTQH